MRNRPLKKLYVSQAVEHIIEIINTSAKDQKLAAIFNNCFPNTLDTTTFFSLTDDKPDTFIITGDIDAMWLRDSTAQVWPYLDLLPDDELAIMIKGLINRQVYCIYNDPYANAFYKSTGESEWMSDITEMKPLLHERKWELDSLCYPIRLAYRYWELTHSVDVFDNKWLLTAKLIVKTMRDQQRKEREDYYTFQRKTPVATDTLADNGLGNRINPIGLIASSFRPSDDATILPFLIPANFFAVVVLRQLSEIINTVYHDTEFSKACSELADEVETAIYKYAVVNHVEFGEIFAYEVDGFGSHLLMDDANVPSLLALPYLGAIDINNRIYQNTRRFILSQSNPWYFKGGQLHGVGSIHTGRNRVWPISIAIQGLTATDKEERLACIEQLKCCHAGTYFMHEGIDCNNVNNYSRSWFAWANTLCGELLLTQWNISGF